MTSLDGRPAATFPFPHPTDSHRKAIAEAAELDRLRSNWLNPPEWVREDVLEFTGSIDGPWSRHVESQRKAIAEAAELAHRKMDEAACAAYGWTPDIDEEAILSGLLGLNRENETTNR